jgi:hypothetical protein
MEEKGILDVFNVDVENISLQEDSKKESVYFKPRQEGKEPYTALIRFLPIPEWNEEGKVVAFQKDKPYYSKKRYWLTDNNGNGNYYDSPATVNERCPIQTTFFRLYGSDDVKDKKAAKDFRILEHYWSLVYIMDDKQNPDLVGKIMIWRFPKDVKRLIEKELDPVVSEYQKDKAKVAVWTIDKGKNLALVVGKKKVTLDNGKEVEFPDYEASEFLESTPLEINGVSVEKNEEGAKLLTDLFETAPKDIESYKYSPWTDEEREEVERILARYNKSFDGVDVEVKDAAINEETAVEVAEGADEADEILKTLNL